MADMVENYKLLADAIVLLAVSDYRDAYKMWKHRPSDNIASGKMEDIRRFFLSQWFGILTNADGESFLERINKDIDVIPPKITILFSFNQ